MAGGKSSGAKSGGVLRHVFTVGGLTAFSRVLGFAREMLQSRLVGAGLEPGLSYRASLTTRLVAILFP